MKLFAATDWANFATEETGNPELEIEFLRALQKMYQLFLRKNHDYGKNNLSTGWLRGVVIRLGDKISRLWTLYDLDMEKDYPVKPEVVSESKDETFLDIGNYGVIGYLMETGKWPMGSVHDLYGHKALGKLLAQIYGGLSENEQRDVLELILASELARDLKAKVVLD